MSKLITKDDFDYGVPLLIAFSGWLMLLGFLYFRYVQYNQDVFSLIASSGDNPHSQHILLIFFSPLITGILGYAVNRRLILYKARYLKESYVKNLAENELIELVDSLILSFVNALDAKSTWTKGHSLRVRHYSLMIARELGVRSSEMNLLAISALLHDIGKIGTYDDILNKVEPLTQEEFALIKKHPANAVEILSPIKKFSGILPIIKGHHEWMNGNGYPDGLVGDAIPFLSRIICVADAYDAITSERPYKAQMSEDEGLREVQKSSGTHFDPAVVAALIAAHAKPSFEFPKMKPPPHASSLMIRGVPARVDPITALRRE
jgi:putative nucleotidyltransferase with HDIG domain